MSQSPVDQLLMAIDDLDTDALIALITPDCRVLTADGRRAEGTSAVRKLFDDFLGTLRSTTHRVTTQWHEGDMWIAEVEATYVLQDWLKLDSLPRAFFLRGGSGAITEVRVYGAHERRLTDHRSGEEGMWIRDRWIPPL